jgi:hypothetical protein
MTEIQRDPLGPLLDNAKVFGVQAATIADVKPNDFIGVASGRQRSDFMSFQTSMISFVLPPCR